MVLLSQSLISMGVIFINCKAERVTHMGPWGLGYLGYLIILGRPQGVTLHICWLFRPRTSTQLYHNKNQYSWCIFDGAFTQQITSHPSELM